MLINILNNGAVGDGITDDSAAINASIQTVNSAGGGVVYIPSTAEGYLCNSGINLSGCSNITLQGDPGGATVIKAGSSLNGSNYYSQNDLIYALNFDYNGTTLTPLPRQTNITVEDLTLDCSLMSASGIPSNQWQSTGGVFYGRNLCAIELYEVNYPTVRRVTVLNAFGNGVAFGTLNPALTVNGVNNGLLHPVIEDLVLNNCVRGLLPQYGSSNLPAGLAGSNIQIGAGYGGRIRNIVINNPGGPATDTFNVYGLQIENITVTGYSMTPVGANSIGPNVYQQSVGTIHSDFGFTNSTIRNVTFNGIGGIILNGCMVSNVFTGNTPAPGPNGCLIENIRCYQASGKLQIQAPPFTASGQMFSNPYSYPLLIQFLTPLTNDGILYRRGSSGTPTTVTIGAQGSILLYAGDAIYVYYSTTPEWIWYLAPNASYPFILLNAGGPTGYASTNTVRTVSVVGSGLDAIQLFGASNNYIEDINAVSSGLVNSGNIVFQDPNSTGNTVIGAR